MRSLSERKIFPLLSLPQEEREKDIVQNHEKGGNRLPLTDPYNRKVKLYKTSHEPWPVLFFYLLLYISLLCCGITYPPNLRHRVSLCVSAHFPQQYRIPQRVHEYRPKYPHTEQNCRAGSVEGLAAAVT